MKYYTSIEDLPIFNWIKVHETADLSFLFTTKKNATVTQLKALQKVWGLIYDEYIKKFGFNENFISQLEREREIALLKIEKAETGDDSLETMIEIREFELKKKKEISRKSDFYLLKNNVEKKIGFRINPREVTVVEFYSYIKTFENEKQS